MKQIILLMLSILVFSCGNKTNSSMDSSDTTIVDTLIADPPAMVVYIQPCDGITMKQAKKLASKLQTELNKYAKFEYTDVEVTDHINLPDSFLYKPRNRYWANKIIADMEKHLNRITIRVTDKDLSISAHGKYNYGILGLSKIPGNSSIVSTYRIKEKDLWKLAMHEFLHSQGLPHCKKDDIHCIMKDAKGKPDFSIKEKLCNDCSSTL